MRDFSGAASSHVVQGAAFAAAARQRAGNITAETRAACRALCGMSVEEASALVEAELEGLSGQGAYEQWRRRIRSRLSDRMGGAN